MRLTLLICYCLLFIQCDLEQKLVNGVKAPEINLANPMGEMMPLSGIENKVVLIDFWASWCKPCREWHPDLVEVYQRFKDSRLGDADGFTVYSVSLDTDKKAWQTAIQQDQLAWAHQVSDLKGFGSEYVDTYQFAEIPTAYLIDENGVIIGKNLTYKWLIYELERREKLGK